MRDHDWFGDETESFSNDVNFIISSALKPFTLDPPSVWCEENIFLAPGRTSLPGKLKLFDYQKEVLDSFADSNVRRVMVPKGSRTGYNNLIACWQLYCAANSRDPIVSVHPTEKSSRTHEETLRSMILNSPEILRLIPDIEDQRWDHKKFLTGAELFFKEASKASNLAEFSARNASADEVDRTQWADGGESVSEGEKLDLLETRLASFVPFGLDKMVVGASPGNESTSRVWPRYMLTDQRKLFMPCYNCGEFNYLKWGGKETDYGVKWNDDPKQARYVCEDCGHEWTEKQRKEALRKAEWRPTAQGIPGWRGYHMNGLMSPFWSLGDLAKEFDKGAKMAAQGRMGSLQAFINTKLGEVWKERDAKTPAKIQDLLDRREPYTAEVPAECEFILAFADTQEGRNGDVGYHEVGFWGVAPGEQFYHLGQFVVRQHGLDDDRHWDIDLEQCLARPWKHASGRVMQAVVACVDTGSGTSDHTHRVVRFCNDNERVHKRMWYATKGYSNPQGKRLPTIWPTTVSNAKRGGYLFVVDTYRAKDVMYERLKRKSGDAGSVHFPTTHVEGALPINEIFFKRLTRERPKVVQGQDATSWAKQPHDQEPWDGLVGCYVGLEALYSKKGGHKLRSKLLEGIVPAAKKPESLPEKELIEVPVSSDQDISVSLSFVDEDESTKRKKPVWKMTPQERAEFDREKALKNSKTQSLRPVGKRMGVISSGFISK